MEKKKRLKRIVGLERSKQEHREKIDEYKGKNEYLIPYWENEIERLDEKIKEEKRKLEED